MEILYSQLEQDESSNIPATLAQLAQLARHDAARARQQLAALRSAEADGDSAAWLAAADAIARYPADLLVPTDVRRTRQVHPAVLLPPDSRADRTQRGVIQLASAVAHRSTSEVDPIGVEPTLRSESELSPSASSELLKVAFHSTSDVFTLQDDWLASQSSRVEITAGEFEATAPPSELDLAALLHHRRELARDPRSPLRVLNLGDVALSTSAAGTPAASPPAVDAPAQVALAILDRDTSTISSRLTIPARCREPPLHFQLEGSDFLPVADHEVHGLSLSAGNRLWTAAIPGGQHAERVRLGPTSDEFCIVQTVAGLCCLDARTGIVRWQRRDVTADTGLYAHEETGLFGDAERLVVVAADQRSCRIFETLTGEFLGTAELPTTDVRRARLVFGSRLAFVTGGEAEPRLRVWDATTRSLLVDVPVAYPFRLVRVECQHLAFLSAEGQVIVLNVPANREVVRHTVDPAGLANLTGMTAWRSSERWFIQTSHSGVNAAARVEGVAAEVHVPSVTVNGVVSAYSPDGSRLLWSRPMENRTLLVEPRRILPFVVALSRTREGLTARSNGLNLEVIDLNNGRVLTQATDLRRTAIAHADYDPAVRRLTLGGELQHIHIQWLAPPTREYLTAERDAVTTTR